MANDSQEAATGTIDLPDDDPDILHLFLEFLYTGSYNDGVVPDWGKPSVAAMMHPREVQLALERQPGVIYAESLMTSNQSKSSSVRYGIDKDVGDSQSQQFASDEEPKEEYVESDAASSSDGQEQSVAARQAKLDDSHSCENSEASRSQAAERNDLFVPLRLYFMADKYDVPALRLLSRDRFYRAAELIWADAECFPDVVDELYSCTSESAVALREIVCRLVGGRLMEDGIKNMMKPVMEKHGEFAVGAMEYLMHSFREQLPRYLSS